MTKHLFGSKAEMRVELAQAMRQTSYNSWATFSRQMNLPFKQLKPFWRFLTNDMRKSMLEIGQKLTEQGTDSRKNTELLVNSYEISGPLGSYDPKLVVDEADLYDKLNDPNCTLSEKWKKKSIKASDEINDKVTTPYKPRKKATSILARIRLDGDQCKNRADRRRDVMNRLQQLREELTRTFRLLYGVDFGMAVGLRYWMDGEVMITWHDIILITLYVCKKFYLTPKCSFF